MCKWNVFVSKCNGNVSKFNVLVSTCNDDARKCNAIAFELDLQFWFNVNLPIVCDAGTIYICTFIILVTKTNELCCLYLNILCFIVAELYL